MPQVISSETGAWFTRIPRPQRSATSLPRLLLSLWWKGWREIAPDLSREENR